MCSRIDPPSGARSRPNASKAAAPKMAARLPPPDRATPSSKSPSEAGAAQEMFGLARGSGIGTAVAQPVRNAHENTTAARRQRNFIGARPFLTRASAGNDNRLDTLSSVNHDDLVSRAGKVRIGPRVTTIGSTAPAGKPATEK